MSKSCPNCGRNIHFDGAKFCPGCGYQFDSIVPKDMNFDWIENILMVHDEKTGKRRVSKAKLVGIVIFAFYILSFLLQSGYFLREGSFSFIFMAFINFVAGLIYYAVCRGIGFVVRKLMK